MQQLGIAKWSFNPSFDRSACTDQVKKAELEIAVAVSCHSINLSVDHFGELVKKNGKGSTVGKINLHRTNAPTLLKMCCQSHI